MYRQIEEKIITQQKDHPLGHKILLQYDTETDKIKMRTIKWMQNFEKKIPLQQW